MDEIEKLRLIIQEKDKEIQELKEHLKKYTAPERNKKYYEKNKEAILKKSNINKKQMNKAKIKEYNRKAYLKRKERLKTSA
ncbi:hypothetical protein Klosneuvirus_2_46 [Klosneuvirus KNV1]|mgnify:CR=1 FL=1|uniref:Uncharacterized protein n=1 Tax=Klosneuvirus KNV1 TaxID=1977640 RepID=A0A1V0SIR3_9VIRU|nr:hypothetical protein Klosneuvirus_2_46 [Klosneuvirus KNV1]